MTAVLALPCRPHSVLQTGTQASTPTTPTVHQPQGGRANSPSQEGMITLHSRPNLGLLFSSSDFLAFLGILLARGHPSVLQPSNQQTETQHGTKLHTTCLVRQSNSLKRSPRSHIPLKGKTSERSLSGLCHRPICLKQKWERKNHHQTSARCSFQCCTGWEPGNEGHGKPAALFPSSIPASWGSFLLCLKVSQCLPDPIESAGIQ